MSLHTHFPIGEEVKSISGYFKILEEGKLDLNGKEFLYSVEMAHADSSCCGGGSAYVIKVPGYILAYKSREDIEGKPISEVEPVTEAAEQAEIRRLLRAKFQPFAQVDFV